MDENNDNWDSLDYFDFDENAPAYTDAEGNEITAEEFENQNGTTLDELSVDFGESISNDEPKQESNSSVDANSKVDQDELGFFDEAMKEGVTENGNEKTELADGTVRNSTFTPIATLSEEELKAIEEGGKSKADAMKAQAEENARTGNQLAYTKSEYNNLQSQLMNHPLNHADGYSVVPGAKVSWKSPDGEEQEASKFEPGVYPGASTSAEAMRNERNDLIDNIARVGNDIANNGVTTIPGVSFSTQQSIIDRAEEDGISLAEAYTAVTGRDSSAVESQLNALQSNIDREEATRDAARSATVEAAGGRSTVTNTPTTTTRSSSTPTTTRSSSAPVPTGPSRSEAAGVDSSVVDMIESDLNNDSRGTEMDSEVDVDGNTHEFHEDDSGAVTHTTTNADGSTTTTTTGTTSSGADWEWNSSRDSEGNVTSTVTINGETFTDTGGDHWVNSAGEEVDMTDLIADINGISRGEQTPNTPNTPNNDSGNSWTETENGKVILSNGQEVDLEPLPPDLTGVDAGTFTAAKHGDKNAIKEMEIAIWGANRGDNGISGLKNDFTNNPVKTTASLILQSIGGPGSFAISQVSSYAKGIWDDLKTVERQMESYGISVNKLGIATTVFGDFIKNLASGKASPEDLRLLQDEINSQGQGGKTVESKDTQATRKTGFDFNGKNQKTNEKDFNLSQEENTVISDAGKKVIFYSPYVRAAIKKW